MLPVAMTWQSSKESTFYALLPACTSMCSRPLNLQSHAAPAGRLREQGTHRSWLPSRFRLNLLQLRGLPYTQVEKEISEGRRQLAACGIPAADVVGFRGPLLETDSDTRKALSKLGFLYDR